MKKVFPLIALFLIAMLIAVPVSANNNDTQPKGNILDFYSNDLNKTALNVTKTANTVDAKTGAVKDNITVDGIVTEVEKSVYTEYTLSGTPNFYSSEHIKPSLTQMTPTDTQKNLIEKLSADMKVWFAQDDKYIYVAFYELGNEWDDQYKEGSDNKELSDGESTDVSLVAPDSDTDKGNSKTEFTARNNYGIRIGFDLVNYNKYLYYGGSIPCGVNDLNFSYYTDNRASLTQRVTLKVAREQRYFNNGYTDFASETGRFTGNAEAKRYHAYTEIAIDKALMIDLFGVESANTLLFSLGTRSFAWYNSSIGNTRCTYSMGGDCVWLGNYLDSDKLLALNDTTEGEYDYDVFPEIIRFGAPTATEAVVYSLPSSWQQKRTHITSQSETGKLNADGNITQEELGLYYSLKYDKTSLICLEGMLREASSTPQASNEAINAELSKRLGDFDFYFAYDKDNVYFAYKETGKEWEASGGKEFGVRHDVDIVIGFIIDGVSCNLILSSSGDKDTNIYLHSALNSQYLYNAQKFNWQRSPLLLSDGSEIVSSAVVTKYGELDGQNGEATCAGYTRYTEMSFNKSALLALLKNTHGLSDSATLPNSMMLSVSARPFYYRSGSTELISAAEEGYGDALLIGTILTDADKIAVNGGMAVLPEVITFGTALCADGCTYTNVTNEDRLIEAATCTSGNKYYKSCATCTSYTSDTFTDMTSVLPHTFDRQITEEKYFLSNATCTQKTLYYYSCVCGESSSTQTDPEDRVTFGVGEVKGHSDISDELTHDASGHWYICGVCKKEVLSATITGKSEHLFDRSVADSKYLVSAATCAAKGVYYKSCVCGEFSKSASPTFETEKDPTAHSFKDEYGYNDTHHWFTCSRCVSAHYVAPHTYVGTLAVKCSVCKATTATPPPAVTPAPETTESEETTAPSETTVPSEITAPTVTTVTAETDAMTTDTQTDIPESVSEEPTEVTFETQTETLVEAAADETTASYDGGCREQISPSGLSLIVITLLGISVAKSKKEDE